MATNQIPLGLIVTDQEILKKLRDFPYLREYIQKIPSNCWPLLLPGSACDFKELEDAIRECRAEEEIRNSVMSVQMRFGLPLRPNLSVRETLLRLRIQKLKKRHRPRRK